MISGITRGMSAAQVVLCILTPDDVARLHPSLQGHREPSHEVEATMQSRPNVFIELGIALGIRRERTIIVEFGRLRPIGDLAGLNVIRFDGANARAALIKIQQRLINAGCVITQADIDHWAHVFNRLPTHLRRPPRNPGSRPEPQHGRTSFLMPPKP
jgi:predicted nucleotide-binding protein